MDTSRIVVYSPQDVQLFEIAPSERTRFEEYEEVNGQHYLIIDTVRQLEKEDRVLTFDATGKVREYVVNEGDTNRRDGSYTCVWSLQHDLAVTRVSRIMGAQTPVLAAFALDAALSGTDRWTRGTVTQNTLGSGSMYQMSGWEAMSVLVENWGGEVDAEITVDEYGVISRKASLLSHLGVEEAKRRFDYSKDMDGVTRRIINDPVAVRIVPRGKGEQVGDGYGRKITIEEVNDGIDWLQNDETAELYKLPKADGTFEYPIVYVDNPEIEDPQKLKEWGLEVIENYTVPKLTYTIDVLSVDATGEGLYGVGLGDSIQCVDKDFGGQPLRLTGRVLAIRADRTNATKSTITIGNVEATELPRNGISRMLYRLRKLGEGHESTVEYLNAILENLNTEINATGGYFYLTDGQGVRTYDVAVSDPLIGAEAHKVVEIKGGSIRIADSRTAQGEWNWRTVFVSGHVAADLITTVEITAGYIGNVSGSYWDLDNNEFTIASGASLGGTSVSQTHTNISNAQSTANGAAAAASDAAKVATNYLTFNSSNGLDIGYSGTNAKTRIKGNGVEVFDGGGNSAMFAGVESGTSIVRVGKAGLSPNVVMSGDGYVDVRWGSIVLAHFGYGTVVDERDQLVTDRYYSIGTRSISSGARIGRESYAIGQSCEASRAHSMAFGYFSKSLGVNSVTLGNNCVASAQSAFAIGNNCTSDIVGAIAIGNGLKDVGLSAVCVGYYNAPFTGFSKYAFVVGAGSTDSSRKNALLVGGGETVINSVKTEINGSLYVSDAIARFGTDSINCYVSIKGNVSVNGTIVHSSDKRLKDHVAYMGEDAADFVRRLRPTLFRFKSDGKLRSGFYAQDVSDADEWGANFVTEESDDGTLLLDYDALIAPLVAYAQQLERRVDEQKAMIELLTQRVEALEAR